MFPWAGLRRIPGVATVTPQPFGFVADAPVVQDRTKEKVGGKWELVMERKERQGTMHLFSQPFSVTLSPLVIRKYSFSTGDSWVM